MMVISYHDDPVTALEAIKRNYRFLHPKTYEVDLLMAEEYLVKGNSVKNIAQKYNYHENAVYNKMSLIKALIDTFYDYKDIMLPNSLIIDIGNLSVHAYKLLLMTIAKYQQSGARSIRRKDIVSRLPYLSHNRHMQSSVKTMRNATAQYVKTEGDSIAHLIAGLSDKLSIFTSVEYCHSVLTYEFSDPFEGILRLGKCLMAL